MTGFGSTAFGFASRQDAFHAIGTMDKKWRLNKLSPRDINDLYEPVFFLEEQIPGTEGTEAALRVMEDIQSGKLRYRKGGGCLSSAIWNHMKCRKIDAYRKEQCGLAKLGRVFRYQVALRSETEELSRPDNIEGREELSFRNDIAGSIATAFSMLEVRKRFVASRICPDRCHKLVKGLLAGKPKGLIAREMGISASSFTRLKDKTLAILKETAPVWAKVSLIGGPDKTGRGTTVILGI